jgi:mannose PTS system EIIA component
MTSLLIMAHAPLASALRQVAEHAFPGCATAVQAIDVLPDTAPAVWRRKATR